MQIWRSKKKSLIIFLVCLAVFMGSFLFRLMELSSVIHLNPGEGTMYTPPMQIPAFSLVDHHGQPFTHQNLKGHWSIVSIGFTYCPDVCPMTLAKMADFYDLMEKDPDVQATPEVLFLSVDPFRDTPEILADYVTFYRPEFIGVTGTPDHLFQLVEVLGLYYRYASADGKNIYKDVLHHPQEPKYSVIHSSHILIINPEGQVGAMLTQPFQPSRLLIIYKQLIRN
nr:SCO family protein [uncultured Desulfobulbus sp.]